MREPARQQSSLRQFGPGRSLLRLAALCVAVLMAVACSIGGSGGSGGSNQPGPSQSGSAGAQQAADEFKSDINGALQTVEEYWRGRFTRAGRQFTPVRRIIPYTQDGEVTCGTEPLPSNNAVYCSAGDFIAYDVNFAVRAFKRIGDAFVYYLLGHEYSHGIQTRLGIAYQFTIEQELQADCMAGAYIGDSVRAKTLVLQPGDIEEFQRGLLAVGDDPGTPWFAPGAHGTAQQRTVAFFNGYRSSLALCGNPAALLGA